MIHPLSDCENKNIPESANIWQFCVIFPNAQIGENCNICSHCLIENNVKIGNNCTVKCGVQLWDGIELEDNVMIGANTTFTNDMYPKANSDGVIEFEVTGDNIQCIHMLPGYTHNIINLSQTENLVTVMYCNEIFDPNRPDTFFEPVV